ncbi:MAG TPA: hypothetical protein VHW73_00145 [Rudaea sp.]|nr:hypothetical protein [Rudaea sp.]
MIFFGLAAKAFTRCASESLLCWCKEVTKKHLLKTERLKRSCTVKHTGAQYSRWCLDAPFTAPPSSSASKSEKRQNKNAFWCAEREAELLDSEASSHPSQSGRGLRGLSGCTCSSSLGDLLLKVFLGYFFAPAKK